MHRWGGFAGRQRYRCTGCSRTFSTHTGTALHYLKRIDRWDGFCRAMALSLTVRETGHLLGLHKDTVFRWRHRFLEAMATTERTVLTGEIVVAQLSFPYCVKGARPRVAAKQWAPPAGRRVGAWPPRSRPLIWVLLARDERGRGAGRWFGDGRPHAAAMTAYLGVRADPAATLVGGRGRYSPLAVCATRLGLRYRPPAARPTRPGVPERPRELASRLRSWIRRFRGVATRYLDNYLLWFRALDCHWSDEVWDLRVVGMI